MNRTSAAGEGTAGGIVGELRAYPPKPAELKNFSESGLLIAPSPSGRQQEQTYISWAEEIRTGPLAVSDRAAVFVDTTTLHSGFPLLGSQGWPTPINILDLCTIIDAIVMFDQVIYFAGEHIPDHDVPSGFKSVFREIEDPSGGRGDYVGSAFFEGFWNEAKSFFSNLRVMRTGVPAAEREVLQRGWNSVLGVSPELALGDPLDLAPGLLSAREISRDLSVLSAAPSDETTMIARTVGASNILGYVNERIANMIGLPYLPNTARIPAVRGYRFSRGQQVARELVALDIVNEAYKKRLAEEAELGTVRLPLLSAAVFAKNPSTPMKLIESIYHLREEAEKLRRYRHEHARLLLNADEASGKRAAKKARESSKKLRVAVERESVRLSDILGVELVLGGLAGGLQQYLTAPWNLLNLGVSVLLGAAAPPGGRITNVILERLFHRHLWLLTNLAESAQALTDARVRRAMTAIWQLDDAAADHLVRRLYHLSEAGTFA